MSLDTTMVFMHWSIFPSLIVKWGWIESMDVIERYEFIDISPIFLATNLDEQVKNIDYLELRILIWYRMYRLYVFWKLLIRYELFC